MPALADAQAAPTLAAQSPADRVRDIADLNWVSLRARLYDSHEIPPSWIDRVIVELQRAVAIVVADAADPSPVRAMPPPSPALDRAWHHLVAEADLWHTIASRVGSLVCALPACLVVEQGDEGTAKFVHRYRSEFGELSALWHQAQLPQSTPPPAVSITVAPFASSEHLVLRGFKYSDLDALESAYQDPDIRRWLVPGGRSRTEILDRIFEDPTAVLAKERHLRVACADRATDQLAGVCLLSRFEGLGEENARAEVVVWAHPAYRGAGLAREAYALGISWIFKAFRLIELITRVHADNPRSRHLIEAFGFQFERTVEKAQVIDGQPMDVDVFRMSRVEFESRYGVLASVGCALA